MPPSSPRSIYVSIPSSEGYFAAFEYTCLQDLCQAVSEASEEEILMPVPDAAYPSRDRALYDPAPDRNYVWVPQRLLDQLYDNPLAVALYVLIVRRWLTAPDPHGVALSEADVLRYDPTLCRGAVHRAFQRLLADGWLMTLQRGRGRKLCYIPAWGRIKGHTRAWTSARKDFGRKGVRTVRVDRALLDTYLGRLITHRKAPAQVERWLEGPAISLRDVGTYVVQLRRHTAPSQALEDAGLAHQAESLPVPALAETLVKSTLSDSGLRQLSKITLHGRVVSKAPSSLGVPFFWQVGLIGQLIGQLIALAMLLNGGFMASETDEAPVGNDLANATGTKDTQGNINPPTPLQPTTQGGHVESIEEGFPYQGKNEEEQPGKNIAPVRPARPRRQKVMSIPDTPSALRLREINVRPELCIELADVPLDTIEAAIADGKARPKVKSLAGWVVAMVRVVRDHGWQIAMDQFGEPPSNGGPSLAELQIAIEKAKASGQFRYEGDGREDEPWPAFGGIDDQPQTLDSQAHDESDLSTPAPPGADDQRPDLDTAPDPDTAPVTPTDDPQRPGWIKVERWQALSPILCGLLRGSQLRGRKVVAADQWKQNQLMRFEAELSLLIAFSHLS